MAVRLGRNGCGAAQYNSGVTARCQNQLIVKSIDLYAPHPVGVLHPRDDRLRGCSNVPELHVTVVTASGQEVLAVCIKVQISENKSKSEYTL